MNFHKELKNPKYMVAYSEPKLFEKMKRFAKQAGIKVIYAALLLFYAFKNPTTPNWAKSVIIGALGYFILPLDLIPDFMPIAGYTDDLGALAFAVVTVAVYIDDEVKQKAKEKLHDWFGSFNEADLEIIPRKKDQ